MSRFYLLHVGRRFLPGIYLHFFHRGDQDRDLHNHPWQSSWSLIIWGGYEEERLVNGKVLTKRFTPGSVNSIKADDFHRVTLLNSAGCWSLFFAGDRMQEWGFYDRDLREYYPHSSYFIRNKNKQ